MRGQRQRENSYPEGKLRSIGHSPMSMGRGIFRIPRGKGGLILLAIVIVVSYYQTDLFSSRPVANSPSIRHENVIPHANDADEFTTTIMTTLEETWQTLFQSRGLKYQPPKLVMYRDAINSACSAEKRAIGTFYCPADNTVYASLDLYDEMKNVLGSGGDFTQGYVIAHAVGHHVQKLLGLDDKTSMSSADNQGVLPEQELQADCFAGLWGYRMAEQQILSAGDLQQALNVAQAIDKVQRPLHVDVMMPERFSYSTLEQRYQWFNRGFSSGELAQCLNFDPAAVKP